MPEPDLDPERLLALLRDPNVESQEIAARTGAPREEVGRAARLLHGLARAKPEEVVTLPAPLALAFARAVLAAGRPELLAALAGHASRDVAKEAKRGLHVLRSRGVQVPEAPRPPAPAPAAAPAEPPLAAYGSAIDGHGERAVWLPRSIPGKGIEVAQAVLSDERGLLELQVGMLGRKEWRAFCREIVARGEGMGVGELDRSRAHALVAAARARNEETGQRVPDGADLWLAALGPAAPLPDPSARFPPLPEEEQRAAVAASAGLHDLPLLRGWLADEDYLRGVAAKLDEVAASPLYLDERQRAEQLQRVVAEAVDGYLDAARRARLAARLLSVAEHLDLGGDPERARIAAATAGALAGGAAAAEVPFVRRLVEKAFPAAGEPPPPAEASPGEPLIVAPR
ncbi:MAG TPA: hypothetical protein VML50_05780 [Anaeromyxobacter sp.]|nr:hypothetical protein [Anaeromyxobacter sp.]